jgi:hypothetical protein
MDQEVSFGVGAGKLVTTPAVVIRPMRPAATYHNAPSGPVAREPAGKDG